MCLTCSAVQSAGVWLNPKIPVWYKLIKTIRCNSFIFCHIDWWVVELVFSTYWRTLLDKTVTVAKCYNLDSKESPTEICVKLNNKTLDGISDFLFFPFLKIFFFRLSASRDEHHRFSPYPPRGDTVDNLWCVNGAVYNKNYGLNEFYFGITIFVKAV